MNLFVDSGAFSVYNSGGEVDLQKYIDWIKEYSFEVYANLDVIGDWKASLVNQHEMERQGLEPIPCFHVGEPWDLLYDYVLQYDYIALGGMQSINASAQVRAKWFTQCFRIICGEDGLPRAKVHAFGMTAFQLIRRFPWYSVDSSSWNMAAINGSIYLPAFKGSGPDYTGLKPLSVSERSPSQKGMDKHLNSLSPMARNQILEFIRYKGYEPEDVCTGETDGYMGRLAWNIQMIEHFVETLPEWPWKWRGRGLLL